MNSSAKTRVIADGIARYGVLMDAVSGTNEHDSAYARWNAWCHENRQDHREFVVEQHDKLFDTINMSTYL